MKPRHLLERLIVGTAPTDRSFSLTPSLSLAWFVRRRVPQRRFGRQGCRGGRGASVVGTPVDGNGFLRSVQGTADSYS